MIRFQTMALAGALMIGKIFDPAFLPANSEPRRQYDS